MKKMYLILFVFFALLFNSTKSDIIMDQTNNIYVENIRYTFKQEMYFDYVGVREDHVLFNTTSFYIDAPNNINITMEFLNSSITGADINDILLQFDANTTAGNIYFNISGFAEGSNYTVLRNFTTYGNYTANDSGFISFNISDWSTTNYTITVVLNEFIIRIFNPRPSDGGLDVKVRSGGILTCIDIAYGDFGLTSVYGSNITFGDEQSFDSSIVPNIVMTRQNTTHFVLFWTNATGWDGEIRVGIRNGETITYGPEYKFDTGIIARVISQPINDTHFIFVYCYFNTTSVEYDLNVSVGKITAGNIINILSDRTVVKNAWTDRDGLAKINDTHYVLGFGNDKANATVIVESGGAATNGNFYAIDSLKTHTLYFGIRAINDSAVIMTYYDSGLIPSKDTHFVVGDISSTTITWGNVFNATDRLEAFMARVDEGKVALLYRSASTAVSYTRVITASNTIITAGDEQVLTTTIASAFHISTLIQNRFILGYNIGAIVSLPYFNVGDVDDMNISFKCDANNFSGSQTAAHYIIYSGNGRFVNAYEDTGTNDGRCIVGNLYNSISLIFSSNTTDDGTWKTYCTHSCISENGTYCCINSNFSEPCDIVYYWNVSATDGNITVTDSYKFTTACKLIKKVEPYKVSLLVYIPLGIIPLFFYKGKKYEKRRRTV